MSYWTAKKRKRLEAVARDSGGAGIGGPIDAALDELDRRAQEIERLRNESEEWYAAVKATRCECDRAEAAEAGLSKQEAELFQLRAKLAEAQRDFTAFKATAAELDADRHAKIAELAAAREAVEATEADFLEYTRVEHIKRVALNETVTTLEATLAERDRFHAADLATVEAMRAKLAAARVENRKLSGLLAEWIPLHSAACCTPDPGSGTFPEGPLKPDWCRCSGLVQRSRAALAAAKASE